MWYAYAPTRSNESRLRPSSANNHRRVSQNKNNETPKNLVSNPRLLSLLDAVSYRGWQPQLHLHMPRCVRYAVFSRVPLLNLVLGTHIIGYSDTITLVMQVRECPESVLFQVPREVLFLVFECYVSLLIIG